MTGATACLTGTLLSAAAAKRIKKYKYILNASVFSKEKVKHEMVVMQFLKYFINIHVPYILYSGITKKNLCSLGSFIIIDYINYKYDFIDALNIPSCLC